MTAPGAVSKYHRVHSAISDSLLAQHIAGDITLAARLHTDGRAAAAAVDVDHGGEAAIRAVLAAAESLHCAASGFVLNSGQHNGGHVWLFFDREQSADDLRTLVREILEIAGVNSPEVYPSEADLRLPFGLHRWAGRRGALLVSSTSTPIDIDRNPLAALQAFGAAYRETVGAVVEAAKERQSMLRAAVATAQPQARITSAGSAVEVIHAFNRTIDLVSLLGGKVAHVYASGKVLMHCPCTDGHKNGDKSPSLLIWHGSKGRQQGKQLCGCYSPACRLHNSPGQAKDAFEAYCTVHRIDRREAIRQLASAGIAPLPQASPAPVHITTQPATPIVAPAATQNAPALRIGKREAQLLALYDLRSDWTNRQLAEEMHVHERTVQIIRRSLVEKGLLARQDSTGKQSDITGSPPMPCIYIHDHDSLYLARKGGAILITPPSVRNPLPKDPTARRIAISARRRERLKAMSPDELDRQFRILEATARKCANPRQRAALEYQAREVAELRARAVLRRFDDLVNDQADELADDQADDLAIALVESTSPANEGARNSPPLPSRIFPAHQPNINQQRDKVADDIREIDPSAQVKGRSLNDLRAMLRSLTEAIYERE